MRKISMILFTLLMFSCENIVEHKEFLIFGDDANSVEMYISDQEIDASEEVEVQIFTKSKELTVVRFVLPSDLELDLLRKYEDNKSLKLVFDASIPGTYTINPIKVLFNEQSLVSTDEFSIVVNSVLDEKKDINSLKGSKFPTLLLSIFLTFVFLLLVLSISIVIIRYRIKKNRPLTKIEILKSSLNNLRIEITNSYDPSKYKYYSFSFIEILNSYFENSYGQTIDINYFNNDEEYKKVLSIFNKYSNISFNDGEFRKLAFQEDITSILKNIKEI